MTALDDFMAQHGRRLRKLVVPIYFGLAVVVEEELLAQRPELVTCLDSFETSTGKDLLLELLERIRLDAAVFEHNVARVRDERLELANRRYLEVPRSSSTSTTSRTKSGSGTCSTAHSAAGKCPPNSSATPRPSFTMRRGGCVMLAGSVRRSLATPSRVSPVHDDGLGASRPTRPDTAEDPRGGGCRRSRRVRYQPRGRRDLHARVPRGPRALRTTGMGGGRVPSHPYEHLGSPAGGRRRRELCGADLNQIVRASLASGSSTTGSGSCRVASRTRCPTLPSNGSRCGSASAVVRRSSRCWNTSTTGWNPTGSSWSRTSRIRRAATHWTSTESVVARAARAGRRLRGGVA